MVIASGEMACSVTMTWSLPLAESADPVLRSALAGVADEICALGGSGDEGVEGLEGEGGHFVFDFQGDEAGPGDAEVEAVVGLAARSRRWDRLRGRARSRPASLRRW